MFIAVYVNRQHLPWLIAASTIALVAGLALLVS